MLGESKVGGRIRPESRGWLPGEGSISAEKPARQGWGVGKTVGSKMSGASPDLAVKMPDR